MSVKGAVLLLSAALAALGAACFLSGSDRIGEKEAARYAEANREMAATLPVPQDSRLISQEQTDCTGSYERNAAEACVLRLAYEARGPLIDVRTFYDDYFLSEEWRSSNETETTRFYTNDRYHVGLGLHAGPGLCPDPARDPEGDTRCRADEMSRDDGRARKYELTISPN